MQCGASHADALAAAERITARYNTGEWTHPDTIELPEYWYHCLHVSKENPLLWCIFPDPTAMIADRPRQTRPAKYIRLMLEKSGAYSDDATVQAMVEYALGGADDNILHIIDEPTPDQIEAIYTNHREHPSLQYGYGVHTSCMSYPAEHYNSPYHPVRVYAGREGGNGIGIVYSADEHGKTYARAIYNTETRQYPRCYHTARPGSSETEARDAWIAALERAGFEQSSRALEGCYLRIDEDGDRIIAPYIDGCYQDVDDDGQIGDCGIYCCNHTNGHSDHRVDRIACPHCGDYFDADDGAYMPDGTEYCCYGCANADGWRCCARCNEDYYSENEGLTTEDGHDYCCEDCARRAGYVQCNECRSWIDADNMDILARDAIFCCERCAERSGFTPCDDCGVYTAASDLEEREDGAYCPDCIDDQPDQPDLPDLPDLPGIDAATTTEVTV